MAQTITCPLVNGVEQSNKYPDTFQIPPLDARQNLKRNTSVKIGFMLEDDGDIKVERMWVKVTNIDVRPEEYWYQGTLQNSPVLLSAEFGDIVQFHAKHILGIH